MRIQLLGIFLVVVVAGGVIHTVTDDLRDTLTLTIQLSIAFGALTFSYIQLGLNDRLTRLHDFVAVSITPGATPNSVHFLNTGTVNLYIHRIEVRDEETDILIAATEVFEKPRLLPAGTLEASYYWYQLSSDVAEHGHFRILLFLNDEPGRKWLSEHAGEIPEGNKVSVWSYKTVRHNWPDQPPEEKA
jgi:hypothetical protein